MASSQPTIEDQRLSKSEAVLAAVGATLLIVTEMLGAAFAFAWAMGGLIGLGDVGTYVVMAIVAVPGLMASLWLTRRILRVERTLRHQPISS
jgi:membrane protein implicated in regulation of membrane protease activity